MSLPDILRMTRQKAFMSQDTFANAIGVSVATVNRWENGKSKPNLSAMKKLKDFCSVQGMSFTEIESAWFIHNASGGHLHEE